MRRALVVTLGLILVGGVIAHGAEPGRAVQLCTRALRAAGVDVDAVLAESSDEQRVGKLRQLLAEPRTAGARVALATCRRVLERFEAERRERATQTP